MEALMWSGRQWRPLAAWATIKCYWTNDSHRAVCRRGVVWGDLWTKSSGLGNVNAKPTASLRPFAGSGLMSRDVGQESNVSVADR